MSIPLIAICGTTGVGKSRLAIELALSLSRSVNRTGARIINADAMQVYEGLDIITNKVPQYEQQGVEHLLMGFKKPGEQYIVGEWVRDATHAIEETHHMKQIPIVVGGTAYWLQHLLFPNSLPSAGAASDRALRTPSHDLDQSLDTLPQDLSLLFQTLPDVPPSASTDPDGAFALHALLSHLDSSMAARWHWKDTRKVLRNLQIIAEHGRPASEVIKALNKTGMIPRYRTLVFWLYAEEKILDCRLDQRVDQMLEQNLLNEIKSLPAFESPLTLTKLASAPGDDDGPSSDVDYTTGIYQAIGFREFHTYLTTPNPTPALFTSSTKTMKSNTRKYAKRQVQWFRNKFLPAANAANELSFADKGSKVIRPFVLDATDVGEGWKENVLNKATSITEAFLSGSDMPDPVSIAPIAENMLNVRDKPTDASKILVARRKLTCPFCTTEQSRPVMIEEGREWAVHQQTRSHKYYVRKSMGSEPTPEELEVIERKRRERRERKAGLES